jgi:dTDP-4-dehydrorhamnose reductase
LNILVLGSDSQIGKSLKKIDLKNKYSFFNKKKININNYQSIKNKIYKLKPNVVINCAAYTNVEKAESFRKDANKLNHLAVKNLAKICFKIKCLLIHFSTDYVFEGKDNCPYNENSKTTPINYYGKTKLLGEKAIKNSNCNYIIIRTSWLFSEYGNNFLKKVIDTKKKIMEIVNDQTGAPTYAGELALAVDYILSKKNILNTKEIFHFSGSKVCSWYNFAKIVVKLYGKKNKKFKKKIIPILSNQLTSKVNRPKYSVLNNKKFINFFKFNRRKLEYNIRKVIAC